MRTFVRFFSPLLLSSTLFAQSPSSKAPPPKPDFSQEAALLEHFDRKVKFENDGTSTVEDSERVRIQSDAGVKRYGLLTFSYASATGSFEIESVRVTKPDSSVVETQPDSFQDMPAEITREAPFYSDLHEKHVAVKGLGIGDVLEFRTLERVTKPLAPGQFWFEYQFTRDSIILDEQLEVRVPRDRPVKIKSPDFEPITKDEGEDRVYRWKTSNTVREDDKIKKQHLIARVVLQQRGRLPNPHVRISTFQSWDELGHWYQALQSERVKPTAEIRAKAAELTKSAPDDQAKVRAIYSYVGTQFRYIGVAFGIGRYQPHSAADVLDNQYGDCKDKHTLLASLLEAAGFKAYPALISTERDLDPDIPSPAQFNHVITAVQLPSGVVWLDSTTEVGPFQYLIPPLRNKQALVVWQDKPAALVATPSSIPFPSTQNFRINATLSDDGTLTGDVDFTARGDLEYVLRSAFRSVPLPQWKDLAQKISYGMGFGGDVTDVTAGSPDKTDEPFHFAYKYTRKEFADWPNRRILAPAPAMYLPLPDDDDAAPPTAVWLGALQEMDFHTELRVPKDYFVDPPSAIHTNRDFADYDVTYQFKNGVLVSDRRLRTLVEEVPLSGYASYKVFRKAVYDDYGAFIPLLSASSIRASIGSISPPGAALDASQITAALRNAVRDLPDSPDKEALRLEGEANDDMSHGQMASATSALYRAVAQDPKFTRAWVTLGNLLVSSQQIDAGLDAFHRAVASDPNHPAIYKAFGSMMMLSRRYNESLPIWQDYIKLAPEDVEGPSNLGDAYFELKRYPEAAAMLESALKLNPDRLSVQHQLALSYLRAGSRDKVGPAFRRLLEMDPRPDTLDALAFELADADQDLPLALEFAQRASRSEEEDSRKATLAQLQLDDLLRIPKIAAYWNTTGRVLSRMSRLEEAEKYLTASWMLSQSGLAASYLCQLYEREHQTQRAVQMCQYAIYRLPMAMGAETDRASHNVMEETRARLEHLGVDPSKGASLHTLSDDMSRLRSFPLPRMAEGPVTAEFFVILKSDEHSPAFKAQDVKFASGSDQLKLPLKLLAPMDLKLRSPDGVATTVVRRGVLACYPKSGCSLSFLDPSIVRDLK